MANLSTRLCRVCGSPATAHPRAWYCSAKCRLLSHSIVDPETGCWTWNGYIKRGPYGYGLIGVNKATVIAHRWSYEQFRGRIPDGLVVMHSCSNRLCVNPDHLDIGTQKENVKEQIARGVLQKPLGYNQAIQWAIDNQSRDLLEFLAHHFGKEINEVKAALAAAAP